jgi:DNA-binding NarL/FixJ family response regulator
LGAHVKILVVDDSAPFRALIRAMLAAVTRDIDECEDGADAAAAYAHNRPDVVLMDIRMKRMDGFVATRTIITQDPSAKIVIVSSYDDEALRKAAGDAGACGYALKDDLASLTPLIMATVQDGGRSSEPAS